jgi:hypothetical protein
MIEAITETIIETKSILLVVDDVVTNIGIRASGPGISGTSAKSPRYRFAGQQRHRKLEKRQG